MALFSKIFPMVLPSSIRRVQSLLLHRSIGCRTLFAKPVLSGASIAPNTTGLAIKDRHFLQITPAVRQIVRSGHKMPLTFDYIRERILLVLRLYDKINPDKLTLDSHFYNDLGLDSLDHVELIMAIEDEFQFEIPDVDAERLNTPNDILKYISIKEEIYPELEHHNHEGHH